MERRTLLRLAAASGLLLLTGCATTISSPQEAYDGTSFKYDKYTRTTKVMGKPLFNYIPPERQIRYLVTSLDSEGRIAATWIDVNEDGDGFLADFVIAHDDQARPL